MLDLVKYVFCHCETILAVERLHFYLVLTEDRGLYLQKEQAHKKTLMKRLWQPWREAGNTAKMI